jgi:hypothetical protein
VVGRRIADGCPYKRAAKRYVADRGVFYGCIAEGCVAKYISR